MTRKEILDTAERTICHDREDVYGPPERNFRTIAALWESYLAEKCVSRDADFGLAPEDVAVMMALLKIARIATGWHKADNWIDFVGYAACGGEEATRYDPIRQDTTRSDMHEDVEDQLG